MAQNHSGHRQRMRNRLRETGLEGFNDINALELLLFYVLPRQDTNLLAHRLLDRFGTLQGVLDAREEQLLEVEGMGEAGAQFFPLVRALALRADLQNQQRLKKTVSLQTPEQVAQYLLPYFYGRSREAAFLLCLDLRGRPLACQLLSDNSTSTAVAITCRTIVETALRTGAQVCALAHNHPGGFVLPSGEDLDTTKAVYRTLSAVGVQLADHVIVSGNDWYSMAGSGLIAQMGE